MATALPNGIEIFRAGTRADTNGVQRTITEADLAACAAAYDPALHEAPLTVGHPASDLPAYGWVGRLQAAGPLLSIDPRQVEPQFAELVSAGRFKKRSAAFYTPDHPSNPKPGTWYLRHVAWLGAEPPSVKGLKDPAFSDDATGLVEFSEPIPALTQPQQEQTMSAQDHQAALDAANTATTAEKARADKAEADLKAMKDAQLAAGRAANAAFAEEQVKAGRVLPAGKAMLVATLNALAGAEPVEFSEGDSKKQLAPADWLRSTIASAKPLIAFGEHAPGKVTHADQVTETTSDDDFDRAVKARMAKDSCSYSEAASKLTAGFTS